MRIPGVHDSVILTDANGVRHHALVAAAPQPGDGECRLHLCPMAGVVGVNWSHSVPFSASAKPGHWSPPDAA